MTWWNKVILCTMSNLLTKSVEDAWQVPKLFYFDLAVVSTSNDHLRKQVKKWCFLRSENFCRKYKLLNIRKIIEYFVKTNFVEYLLCCTINRTISYSPNNSKSTTPIKLSQRSFLSMPIGVQMIFSPWDGLKSTCPIL